VHDHDRDRVCDRCCDRGLGLGLLWSAGAPARMVSFVIVLLSAWLYITMLLAGVPAASPFGTHIPLIAMGCAFVGALTTIIAEVLLLCRKTHRQEPSHDVPKGCE
jgi:hypothetical protein